MMTVTDKPWDGSASRWQSPLSYCASCLVDANDGAKTKASCMLPVREPTGEINRDACHAAAAALAGARGASIPAEQRQAAAKRLIRIYQQDLNEDPGESLVSIANGE